MTRLSSSGRCTAKRLTILIHDPVSECPRRLNCVHKGSCDTKRPVLSLDTRICFKDLAEKPTLSRRSFRCCNIRKNIAGFFSRFTRKSAEKASMVDHNQHPPPYEPLPWLELSEYSERVVAEMPVTLEPHELGTDEIFGPVLSHPVPIHNTPQCPPQGADRSLTGSGVFHQDTFEVPSPISPCSDVGSHMPPSLHSPSFDSTLTPSDTSTPKVWNQALASPFVASPTQYPEGLFPLDGDADKIFVPDVMRYDINGPSVQQFSPPQLQPQELYGSQPLTEAQKICQRAGYGEFILGPWENNGMSWWVRRSHTVSKLGRDSKKSTTSSSVDRTPGNLPASPPPQQQQHPAAPQVPVLRRRTVSSVPESENNRLDGRWHPSHCPLCNRVFKGQYGRGNMNRHMKHKHQSTPEITCRVCKKTYQRTDALHKHKKEKGHW